MSMGSSNSGNGTTTSTSSGSANQQLQQNYGSTGPWGTSVASATQALNNADYLYNSGQLNPTGQAATTNQNLINLGMGSQGLNTSNSTLSGIAGTDQSAANPATSYLTSIANGTSSNAALNSMYSQAANAENSTLNGQFDAAGRINSGAQAFNTGQADNNLATDLYGTAYDNNQNRALTAAQTIGSNYTAGVGDEISAASGLGTNYNLGLTGATDANTAAQATTPLAALENYNSLIYPYTGIGSTSSSTGTGNSNEQDAGSSTTYQLQSNAAMVSQYLQMIASVAGGG